MVMFDFAGAPTPLASFSWGCIRKHPEQNDSVHVLGCGKFLKNGPCIWDIPNSSCQHSKLVGCPSTPRLRSQRLVVASDRSRSGTCSAMSHINSNANPFREEAVARSSRVFWGNQFWRPPQIGVQCHAHAGRHSTKGKWRSLMDSFCPRMALQILLCNGKHEPFILCHGKNDECLSGRVRSNLLQHRGGL